LYSFVVVLDMKRLRARHPHAVINRHTIFRYGSTNRTYDGEEQKSGGGVSWPVGAHIGPLMGHV
jgi:hypothetical protein